MKDDRALDPEALQDVRHLRGHRPVSDPEGLVLRARWVAKRTKHVEHSSQAKLAPRDAGETKRRVKHRRKQESDPGLVNAARDNFRRKVDLNTQTHDHVI